MLNNEKICIKKTSTFLFAKPKGTVVLLVHQNLVARASSVTERGSDGMATWSGVEIVDPAKLL